LRWTLWLIARVELRGELARNKHRRTFLESLLKELRQDPAPDPEDELVRLWTLNRGLRECLGEPHRSLPVPGTKKRRAEPESYGEAMARVIAAAEYSDQVAEI